MEYKANRYLLAYMTIVGLLFVAWVPFGVRTVVHIASVEHQCRKLGYTSGWIESWSYNNTTGCVSWSKDRKTVVRDTVLTK